MAICIIRYSEKMEKQWDTFVNSSLNGTFLQTRNFLNYHPIDRFVDHSLVFLKGEAIIAVVPACEIEEDGKKVLVSHRGSSYGGIIVSDNSYNIDSLKAIFELFSDYISQNGFSKVILKNTPPMYCKENMELIDYFLYYYGFKSMYELNLYIDYGELTDVEKGMSHTRRIYYNKAIEYGLKFKKITTVEEIRSFHEILAVNLQKFDKRPVHSVDDLCDLYYNRISENIEFYGVFLDDKMIGGTMLFKINGVLHTQYLATDPTYSDHYTSYFLYGCIIKYGLESKYKILTFGISTEDNGTYLNEGLAKFKESFGAKYSVNKMYEKLI